MLFQTDMTTDKRIEDLFQKYFDKTAKEEERRELMHLINETGSDDELLLLIENAYRNYVPSQNPFGTGRREKMLQQIHSVISGMEKVEAPVRIYKKIQWFRYAAAASVLLFVAVGIYFFGLNERKLAKIDFNPGGNKAILTLSNGATINLDDAKDGQVASQGEIAINKTHDGEVNYDASHLGKNVSAGYNKIATPKGGQYKVVLADGTKAWLNSVSSISFPTAFDGEERHVEITGEVYFEVTKNKKQPFFVKAGKQIVEVLGTHFNINSYTDEPDIKTTLLEGSVKVKQLNTGFSALLKPGQQSISESTGPILIHDADLEQAIAWKNGLFQINNANIETIMRQAARWYDVDIAYEGKIPERKFSGKIKRNVKASEFLQMLTYFNVKFSIEGRKIIVKN